MEVYDMWRRIWSQRKRIFNKTKVKAYTNAVGGTVLDILFLLFDNFFYTSLCNHLSEMFILNDQKQEHLQAFPFAYKNYFFNHNLTSLLRRYRYNTRIYPINALQVQRV